MCTNLLFNNENFKDINDLTNILCKMRLLTILYWVLDLRFVLIKKWKCINEREYE